METLHSDISAAIAAVRADVQRLELSKARLARMAGLHEQALRDFYKDAWNPRASTLRKLEDAIRAYQTEMRPDLYPVPE